MEWSRDFTALVLHFARQLSRVDGVSLDQALLRGTPLYPNFTLGTAFDPTDPVWQEFLAGYHAATDHLEWTHAFYRAHARQYPPHPYGCFRYYYNPATRTAGLHFGNLDTSGLGALSRERRRERLHELRAMFADLQQSHPEAEMFAGGSWLYNIPAYRVLFPPEYIATATPTTPAFTYFDVWGQFLNGQWGLRPGPSRAFLDNAESATCHEDLAASFPLWPLMVRAPIQNFYAFYGVPSLPE